MTSLCLPAGSVVDPLDGMMLCRLYVNKLQTASGLVLPQQSREELFFAKIVKIGKGKVYDVGLTEDGGEVVARKPVKFEEGDDVIYSRFRGDRVKIGEDVYALLGQDDAIAKVTLGDDSMFQFAGESDEIWSVAEIAGVPG